MGIDPLTEKSATIEDVAKLAGVSIATVSRVVHNPEKVSESTRKKVRAAIAQSGYTPNAMARNLRRRTSKMILVLLPDIGNPFFANILSGIESVARQEGYGILIGNTDNDPEKEEFYLTYLRSNQADGVILLTGHLPYGSKEEDVPSLPPMIAISERMATPAIPFVGIDNVAAARMATEHLISIGHKEIAHIMGPSGNVLSVDRLQGYRYALLAAGLPIREELILEGDFSIEGGRAAVERLFIRDEAPTAFFCANDEMAIGVILGLTKRGYRVPDEFSVIGFDDIPFASCTTPSLTTVQQPRRQMGEVAMRRLIDQFENGRSDFEPVFLHTDLVVRESTRQRLDLYRKDEA